MALSTLHKGWAYKKAPGILAAVYNEQAFAGAVAHGANTALDGVLRGTPVTPALAVDSMVLSNLVNNGDILIAASTGSNSQAWLWVDSSAGVMVLYAAGVEQVRTSLGNFVVNEGSADINFRVETDGLQYAIYSDGGTNSVVLGSNTDTSSADKRVVISRAARTATSNASYYDLTIEPAGAVTITGATTSAVVASVNVNEPNITATGTVTTAATIYIGTQPTEGTDNGAIVLADGLWLALGTNADGVLANEPSTLANTVITGVLLGTPVTPAIAADTLVISNTTASGDILLAVNLAGNSQAYLWVDSSASLMTLYAAGVSAVEIGAAGIVVNEASADRDFRIESNDVANMLVIDGGTNTMGLGSAVISGAMISIDETNNAAARVTSVGHALHLPSVNMTFNNGDPTTTAISARIFMGTQQLIGSNANQIISDACQLYISAAPTQGTNMVITRAWSLWAVGNVRFGGDVNMADTASDLVIKAATAAALEISDATTKFYAFDTRVATAGVTTHALDIADYTFASAATNVATGLSLAAHTLNYTGTTQVTSEVITVSLGGRTIAGDTATLTVDKASTLKLVAPVEGTNVTLTAASALRIGDAGGTPTNQYGIFIETLTAGATADYAIWVAGANAIHVGTAGTATGKMEWDGATSGTVTVTVAAAAGTWTMTLPPDDGTNGDQLTVAAGDGVCTWAGAASARELKDIQGEHDAQDALAKVLAAKVYDFHYKPGVGTQDTQTDYVGVVADEAPWAMHYKGTKINPINSLGYTTLAIQAMAKEIAGLKKKLAKMGAN